VIRFLEELIRLGEKPMRLRGTCLAFARLNPTAALKKALAALQ
jgi:hypothetical protein